MAPINQEVLLQGILATVGRQTFPVSTLAEIVLTKSGSQKQLRAFNMCDGTRSQADIAKALKLDAGNFSRTVTRWIEAGVAFRLGEGREARILHVYPLPAEAAKGVRK